MFFSHLVKDSSWESVSLTDVGRGGQRTNESFSFDSLSIASESVDESDDESDSIDLCFNNGMGWRSV